MFSIHCKVIKLVRLNWKAYWFETDEQGTHKVCGGTHQKAPAVTVPWFKSKKKKKGQGSATAITLSVQWSCEKLMWLLGNVSPYTTWLLADYPEIFKGWLSEG